MNILLIIFIAIIITLFLISNICKFQNESDDEEFDAELGMRTKIRHERGI